MKKAIIILIIILLLGYFGVINRPPVSINNGDDIINKLPTPLDNGDGTWTIFELITEDGWVYLDSFSVTIPPDES